jgi:5-methylcytosine-specific restriction endonuclease McrBC regulatory subunit McrC
MRTTDNTHGKPVENAAEIPPLRKIANRGIDDIKLDARSDLLVFPHDWQAGMKARHGKSPSIFTLTDDGRITTGNVMGFVGVDDVTLTISSRFSGGEDTGDYFLHYMLQKALEINIVNLDIARGRENIGDFLPYFFPLLLKKAVSQGIYKQYHKNDYNDCNLRGSIDLARHLRLNVPFAGKAAYTAREYSADNALTQLIRHTIEYLRTGQIGRALMVSDSGMRAAVSTIENATPNYRKKNRQRIIFANTRPVNHPYFTGYRPLQNLCLQILRQEKTAFGSKKEKIHGILFDGAWLWEAYLYTVLKRLGFSVLHPDNNKQTGGFKLFIDSHTIYPDFVPQDSVTRHFVADAKYKHIDSKSEPALASDYYQVITYMFRLDAQLGYILFPFNKEDQDSVYINGRTLKINNKEKAAAVIELGLPVPQGQGGGAFRNFSDFSTAMGKAEEGFLEAFLRHLSPGPITR